MAKVDSKVELYYSGDWHNITATDDVFTRDPIRITRTGRGPGTVARPPTSSLNATLDNRDSMFSPRNPMSPLYRLIGRNTPIRVAVLPHHTSGILADVSDTFTRVVVDSWGSSGSGGLWSLFGAGGPILPAEFQVTGTAATHSVLAVNTYRAAYLDQLDVEDVDVAVTWSVPLATGAPLEPANLMLRGTSLSSSILARTSVETTNAVTVRVFSAAGVDLGSATVPGLVHAGVGTPLRTRARIIGRTIFMRVWNPAGAEPAVWHLVATDPAHPIAGWVGIRSGRATGNTNASPVLFTYDNFTTVTELSRFTGEIGAWPQEWTVDGKNVWVPIEAAGIMLRLTAPGRTQRVWSAISSSILSTAWLTGPLAYYPLNDGKDTTGFSNLADPTVSGAAVTTCKPGEGGSLVQDVTLLGFTPDQTNSNNAFSLPLRNVNLPISPHVSTGTYTIGFWHRFILPHPTDGPTRNYHESINNALAINPAQDPTLQDQTSVFHRVDFTGGTVSHVDFRMQQAANIGGVDHVYLNVRNGSNTYIGGPDGFVSNLSDGNWHEVRAILAQNGAVVDTFLYVDGVQVSVGSSTSAATLGTAKSFGAGAYGGVIHPWIPAFQDETWAAYGLAHVSVYTAVAGTFYAAVNGYAGETAGRRIERLCLERGVAFTAIGDLDAATVMGEQRLLTFIDAVYDAVDADMGFLYEPRNFLGLTYRTRKGLYNNAGLPFVRLELTYGAAGEVAPPFKPVEDWDAVANDVTVIRYGGGRATAVKLTGSLNVQEPTADPDGVGRIRKDVQLALRTDAQNLNHAAWIRFIRTWDEARYPVVTMDLAAMADAGKTVLIADASDLDIGDRFDIFSPPPWLPPDTISVHAQGLTEVIESHRWGIAANATPALPYEVLQLETGTGNRSRIPAGPTTTLAGTMTTTSTSRTVAFTRARWIDSATYPAQFPFDIAVAGERMTVTAIVGTTSPQTFTVVRSVNGVVKTHAAGEPVQLFHPPVIAR